MQTQQAQQMQQALPQSNGAQPKVAPQPWVKPTFERLPLNEALSNFSVSGSSDFASSYAS